MTLPISCQPLLASLLVASVVLAQASIANGQVTLLVRDDVSVTVDAPTGADEALRASRGGSVRRLDASLEEMALAAGCPGEADAPSCIAALAAAARAEWLVIERTSREMHGWHVALQLRRGSTGGVLRAVDVSCTTRSACVEALTRALEVSSAPSPPPIAGPAAPVARADLHPSETSEAPIHGTRSVPSTTDVARDPGAERGPVHGSGRPIPLLAQIFFASAGVMSLGALIAGGIGLARGHDAWAIGTITRAEQAEQAAALESSRDWGLGFGTALAITGACLAIAAIVITVVDRPPAGAVALQIRGAAAPSAASLLLDGRF